MTGGRQAGFTLVEVLIYLAVTGLLIGGLGGILFQFQRLPDGNAARVLIQQELATAASWVRTDANRAQSFQAGAGATYGTFRWEDFATFPPTRHSVVYFWEEGAEANPAATTSPFNYGLLYRQSFTNGIAEEKVPLLRHAATPADLSFAVSEALHGLNPFSTRRVLNVLLRATIDGGAAGTVVDTASVTAELRPEQIQAVERAYYYLHNNPTPPAGDTSSQPALSMDAVPPVATSLYNYDVNRDIYPGLRLIRGPAGGKLGLTDATKLQDWLSPVLTSPVTVTGRASLFVHLATSGFEPGKLMILVGWLLDYDPGAASFTQMTKKGELSFTGTSGWVAGSMHFPVTEYTVPAGHQLMVRIQYDGKSEGEGMVAYDTVTHLALLSVPVQP